MTVPSGPSSRLPGFMSRCRTQLAWQYLVRVGVSVRVRVRVRGRVSARVS